jgi:hypothetical protein
MLPRRFEFTPADQTLWLNILVNARFAFGPVPRLMSRHIRISESPMGTALAELPNVGDERAIAACLELIEAGRPISEIMVAVKRVPAASRAEHVPARADRARRRTQLRGPLLFCAMLVVGVGGIGTAVRQQGGIATAGASLPLALAPIPSAVAPAKGNMAPHFPEVEALLEGGSALFGAGNLSGARNLYERAAAAGDARAAMYLALTYDPSFLKQARLGKSVRGDLDSAAYWYRRARVLGVDG